MIVLDFETWGAQPEYALMPWRTDSWITVTAYGTTTAQAAIVDCDTERMVWLLSQGPILTWNGVFDIAWLLKTWPELRDQVYKTQWIDVMLLWQRVEAGRHRDDKKWSFSLKNYAKIHTDLGGYEGNITDYGTVTPELLEYAKTDIKVTAMAWNHLSKLLPVEERKSFEQECACLPMFAEAWLTGLRVDANEARGVQRVLRESMMDIADSLGITEEALRSSQQLGKVLYGEWGAPVLEVSEKTQRPSTAKATIMKAAKSTPQAAKVLVYKSLLTESTKFCEGVIEASDYNGGTAHPQPRISGTYTGRVTYSAKTKKKYPTGIALHQWPRGKKYRGMVRPHGTHIIEIDAAGQEMRLMADYSRDETMLGIFLSGRDGHALMGANVHNKDYDWLVSEVHNGNPEAKLMRQIGKFANLSLQYRIGARTMSQRALVQGLDLTERKCGDIIHIYKQTYPGVPMYWRRAVDFARQKGYAQARDGRRAMMIDGDYGNDQTAINFPIQGTGAAMKYYALAAVRQSDLRMRFAWDMHDGLYFDCPIADKQEASDEAFALKNLLDNLDYSVWGWKPLLPLVWDIKIGTTWGNMEEVK